MSHNIKLSGVKFTDLNLLGKIVAQVSNGAARLDQTATTFRTYPGQPNQCQAAILLPGNFDIGLLRNGDHYTPIMESFLMGRETPVGVVGAPLGLVQQEYALQEAEYEAAQRGMVTERIAGEKGRITLRMVLAD